MSLRLSDLLRRDRKMRGLAARSLQRRPLVDSLEERVLLSNVAPLNRPTSTDVSDPQAGPLSIAGPGLFNLYQSYAGYQANGSQGTYSPPNNVYVVRGDQVAVDVTGWGDQASFLAKAQAAGMTIGAVDSTSETAEGWVPIAQLPALAQVDQVAGLSAVMTPHFSQEGSAPNQSDRTMYADAARSQYGVDGTGVKIGVISDSVGKFDGALAASAASGDVPNNVHVLDDRGIGSQSDEGLAMLEEIYDIAPGASLYFTTAEPAASPGDLGFATAVTSLVNAGCTVIVDDYYAPDEPFFQNGIIGQAIDSAVSQGVTYLSAEGNANDVVAQAGPGEVGGYASQFRSVQATIPGVGSGKFMNFNADGGPSQTSLPFTVQIPGGPIDIQWDNPFQTNGVKTEIDAYLIDPTTGQVAASARANSINNGQPVQMLDTTALTAGMTYNLVLKVAKGAVPNEIEAISLSSQTGTNFLLTGSGTFTEPDSGTDGGTFFPTAFGHATDPNVVGVGAVAWWDASPYDGNIDPTPSEPFSSNGPALQVFDDSGNRLATPQVIQTPVISGADGNDISFLLSGAYGVTDVSTLVGATPDGEAGTPAEQDLDGIPNFFGTSSSAGNVAAVVALMQQSNNTATPSDIRDSLIESALPLNGALLGAYDPQGGFGLVQATTALRSINDHLSVSVSPPQGVYELTAITDDVIGTFTDAGAIGGAAAFTATVDWGDGNVVDGQIVAVGGNEYDVIASNTYALGGTYNVTVTVDHTGYSTRVGTSPVVIVPYPISLTAVNPVTLQEGQSYNGPIATLVDSLPVASKVGDYTTTITWSDGTTSTATYRPVAGQANTYTISTIKNFQLPGDYTFSVATTDTGTASDTLDGTQTVDDAPLLPGAVVSFSPTEGQIFSGTVAKFVDKAYANGVLSLPLADYSATVTWGDGQTSPGLVQNDPNQAGGFLVVASHRYSTYGTNPFSVTITDVGVPTDFPASSVSISKTITVLDASLTSQGTSFGLVEGTAFNGTAATFQSGDPSAPLSDFSATINWGDGTAVDKSATIVPTGSGGYRVQANHVFTLAGTYIGTVTINDAGGNSTKATINASAKDAPISLATTGLLPITTVEGSAFNGTVAILTDGNPFATLSQYKTVTIDWGDGTKSNLGDATNPVQVVSKQGGAAGAFTISDTHTYTHFGSYVISTTVNDVGGSVATTTLGATATAATIVASGVSPIQGQLGIAYTGPVATFYDSNPTPTLSDFSAKVNWGDGATTTGNVVQNVDGSFSVSGAHIYLVPIANATITVSINDAAGQSRTVTSQITVPDATLSPIAVTVSPTPTEGTRFNALVGQFSDSNPSASLSTLSATIDWGDGSTPTAGTIVPDDGNFDVRGQHLYAAGDYEITVSVASAYGSATKIISTVNVVGAALSSTAPTPVTLVKGTAYTGPTLNFASANPTATAASFAFVQIDWGDGTISSNLASSTGGVAAVTPVAGGAFSVSGSHTYSQVGTYAISTTVESSSGQSTTQTLTATVQDAALAVKAAGNFTTKIGSTSPVTVATIAYADLTSVPASFVTDISWGDGSSTFGTIVPDTANGAGHFLVMGSHAYQAAGSYNLSVAVADASESSQTVTLGATVTDAAIVVTSQPLAAVSGDTVAGPVATFTSANPSATAASFSATINWGDGTTTPGAISAVTAGVYSVSGSHTYANAGTDPVLVTVTSKGGSTAATSQQVVVAVHTQQITATVDPSSITGLRTASVDSTRVYQPAFDGSGQPGNIITLTAQRTGLASPQVIAQVAVNSDGSWKAISSSLLAGTYTVVASATDAQGNVTSSPVALPTIQVDNVAPRITGVTLNPKIGQATINIQDDFSGLSEAVLSNPANYVLTLPTAKGTQTIAITGITVSSGGPTSTRVVTLNFASNTGRRARKLGVLAAGKYVLTVNGSNLVDNAGNTLSDTFFTLPSATKPNTGFIAALVTDGHTIATPQSLKSQTFKAVKAKALTISKAAKPQAPKFHKS